MEYRDKSHRKTCAHCGDVFYRDIRCTWAHWGRAKFCSRKCAGAGIGHFKKMTRPSINESFLRWFDAPDEGCWLWKGAVDKNGYGIFTHDGKTMRAARLALNIDGRPPSPNEYACHHCDNPRCVRPSHLYAGTPSDNVADMISKKRHPHGCRHYKSILSEKEVLVIRASKERASILAKNYGVSHSNISMIRAGKTWKHLL